jgi:three-Cys-motif partner protein
VVSSSNHLSSAATAAILATGNRPRGTTISSNARPWSYWTRNKLEILKDYLPAFTTASSKSSECVYLDLMAGQPKNIERHTGTEFDGSPVLAMKTRPAFSRLRFGELSPTRAAELDTHLRGQFPRDNRYQVVQGDCNEMIDAILADLADVAWAPTFAFVDQQAAEVHWETIEKLASFRRNKQGWKTEIWILMSPTMILKGVRGVGGIPYEPFRQRVDRLYGTTEWRVIQNAFDKRLIVAREYRRQMVNLMRWRLEHELGYAVSHRIPMQMHNKVEIYDMVFATDHEAGDRIMRHLYNQAAQREPEMMRQAKEAKSGQFSLFENADLGADDPNAGQELWRPEPCWNPVGEPWWEVDEPEANA